MQAKPKLQTPSFEASSLGFFVYLAVEGGFDMKATVYNLRNVTLSGHNLI
jgi:hypothetical protein